MNTKANMNANASMQKTKLMIGKAVSIMKDNIKELELLGQQLEQIPEFTLDLPVFKIKNTTTPPSITLPSDIPDDVPLPKTKTKNAKTEADKAAKAVEKAAKAAEKAAKAAAKDAEKAAKAAAKDAKAAAKDAEKAAKAAAKDAKAAAKADKKTATNTKTKQKPLTDGDIIHDDEHKDTLVVITIRDTPYLRSLVSGYLFDFDKYITHKEWERVAIWKTTSNNVDDIDWDELSDDEYEHDDDNDNDNDDDNCSC